jgi:hypothetical protein
MGIHKRLQISLDHHLGDAVGNVGIGFVLTVGAIIFDYLGQPDEQLQRGEEAERIGLENSLPFLTQLLVPIFGGIALVRNGQLTAGVISLKSGLAYWNGVNNPYLKSVLAQGFAQLGDVDSALCFIEEATEEVERPGWEERHYYAETLRIKGWLLSLKGDPTGAERAYIGSLDWARTQQAKTWELRTATSYARLMRDQGRVTEAHELLAPVYA